MCSKNGLNDLFHAYHVVVNGETTRSELAEIQEVVDQLKKHVARFFNDMCKLSLVIIQSGVQ
jgi:mevalonate pyrophosphate decarboxylase